MEHYSRGLRYFVSTLTVLATAFMPFASFVPNAGALTDPSIVYDAIPSVLPPNAPSQPFQAQQTSEFGDYIHLGSTYRHLEHVTVAMSDWALYADYSADSRYMANSVSWSHPITLNIYSNHLGVNGAPDTLLATKTQNIDVPWRPAGDPTCPDTGYGAGFAWRATDGNCYNGFAFNAVFDLSSLNVFLPDDIIVGIAYNTQSYGASPLGVNGPYNSLNVLVPPNQPVTVGSDDDVAKVFWNTSTAGYYADGGAAGVGIFRQDWNWAPYGTVALRISVSAPASYSGAVTCSQGKEPSLIATYPVYGNDVDGVSFPVTSGAEYLFKASSTFIASSDTAYVADAGYTTHDGWTSLLSQYGINGTGQDKGAHALLADLGAGMGILDWGSYNPTHEYAVAYTPTTSTVQFVIGDRWGWWFNTPYQNQAGMSDNQGALSLAVYECKTPPPPPTKDQCKNGGWKTMKDDTAHSFKNQGDCVSFFATKGKNKGAGN